MDDLACASCRKVLSLEEVERGNFKHLGGSLYCAECVAKMRRVGPTACSACGTTDTPLYNGKAYVCRKCGARLKQDDKPKPPPAKPQPAPAAAPRPKREGKSCPYCNGIIPAQALKCRYCGSHLTRDARDVEALSHQNLRLRFWLGSLLTASVFLFLILIYIVTRTPEPPEPVEPPVKASAQDTSRIAEQERKTRDLMAKIQSLEDERAAAKAPPTPKQDERLTALQQELAALRREMAARDAKAAPVPAPPTPIAPKKAPEPKDPTPPPVKNKKGNPPPVPSPHPRIAVPPPPSPVPPKTADTAKAKQAAAKRADEAFPALEARARKLAADGKFGAAFVLCRSFAAEHFGAPAAGRAKTLQEALRLDLDGIREEHGRAFRAALEKKDLEAARKALAALKPYDAPGVREDKEHMAEAMKTLAEKPRQAVARYLAQWKVPPTIEKAIRELKAEDAHIRQNATEKLKREKHRSAVGPLIAALADEDWYIATKAIEALAAIGDPIALPAIARQTKAAHPVKYSQAAKACETLARASREEYKDAWALVDTKRAVQEIVEALQLAEQDEKETENQTNVDPDYPVALLKTLGHLKAKEALPIVQRALKSKHPEVQKAAANTLKTLTN